MRVLLISVFSLVLAPSAMAFVPAIQTKKPVTKLEVHRRDVLAGIAAGLALAPGIANAAGST